MKKVEIYKLSENGAQETIVTCKLLGEIVSCEGEAKLVEYLTAKGIADYSSSTPVTLYPQDGLRFLQQLKFNFKSGYISASDVIEQ